MNYVVKNVASELELDVNKAKKFQVHYLKTFVSRIMKKKALARFGSAQFLEGFARISKK